MAIARLKTMLKLSGKHHPVAREVFRLIMIIIGAILFALGLQYFLVPSGFLDGGVTGISIMLVHVTGLPLGLFLAVVNLPFVVIAWKFSGIKTAIHTIVGVAVLSGASLLLEHQKPLTDNFVLALGYGGVLLGLGIGLSLRYGGALDGADVVAHIISHRSNLDTDKLILGFNFVVFLVSAFVIAPESAMASFLLYYVVVAPIVKRVLENGTGMKQAQILSEKSYEIGQAIHATLGRRVFYSNADRSNHTDALRIVNTILSGSEETVLVDIAEAIDADAIIIFSDVTSVHGANMYKLEQ